MNLTLLQLNNYWLPLLWVFGAGLILQAMPRKAELCEGEVVWRWYGFTAILMVLPLIVWAGARVSFGDTFAYRRAFDSAPVDFSDLPAYMDKQGEDRGFYLVMAVLKCLGMRTSTSFFMLVAVIQMLCLVHTFRRYSGDFWICIFLFVASTDYFSWMFNGMRQFIAAAIIFSAFGLLIRRRYLQYALVIIVASQFHASALIMLPLALVMRGPALNRKTLLLIMVTAAAIPFIDRFLPFLDTILADTQYSGITSDEVWSLDDGTSIFRVLVYSVPALIALVGWRYIRNCRDPVMNMCINAAIITMAIYLVSSVTSGIYIGRLPVYTTFQGYIALPWLIDQMFEKRTAGIIKALMIGCYAAFYYYQMGVIWGIL